MRAHTLSTDWGKVTLRSCSHLLLKQDSRVPLSSLSDRETVTPPVAGKSVPPGTIPSASNFHPLRIQFQWIASTPWVGGGGKQLSKYINAEQSSGAETIVLMHAYSFAHTSGTHRDRHYFLTQKTVVCNFAHCVPLFASHCKLLPR